MFTGTVKHFDTEKKFGFITLKDLEVFFHMSFGGIMACLNGDKPEFVKCVLEREPKSGETLLFDYDQGPRGFRATKWAYPESLQQALNQVGLKHTYRFIQRKGRLPTGSRLHNSLDARYTVLWQGTDLEELRTRYPKATNKLFEEEFEALYFKVHSDGAWTDTLMDPR